MKITRFRVKGAILCAVLTALAAQTISAQQSLAGNYITGVVQGEKGPEAGVWVIAETKDLLTQMIKIVVTDDRGRFLVPDLPKANYKVWVRGYGLVDSTPSDLKADTKSVTLKVTSAKTPQEAAKVYPGDYWLSLMAPPPPSEFPGTGDKGNGMGTTMTDQAHWINTLKSNCNFCHQLGNALTRDVTHVEKAHPDARTSTEAWEWRLGTGVRGNSMYSALVQMGKTPSLKTFADWTDAVAAGAVPPMSLPRLG